MVTVCNVKLNLLPPVNPFKSGYFASRHVAPQAGALLKGATMRFIDLTGKRFGRWLAIKRDGHIGKSIAFLCKCDCGTIRRVVGARLVRGESKSCDCLKIDIHTKRLTTHGATIGGRHTPTFSTWVHMRGRCNCKSDKRYLDYGGRGIKVCKRWLHSFENFLADMGEKPMGMTIERIDNNGDYEPSNCRWATKTEQCQNTRRCIFITHSGKTQNLTLWCKELGLNYEYTRMRIRKLGWSIGEALFGNKASKCIASPSKASEKLGIK